MNRGTVCRVTRGCVACGTCVYECPAGAIRVSVRKGAEIDEAKCTGCGKCIDNCVAEAIERVELQE